MRSLAIGAMVVCACDGLYDDRAPDPLPPPPGQCGDIANHLIELVATADDACVVADDCTTVGGVGTCECAPFVAADCAGDPISVRGFEAIRTEYALVHARWDTLDCFHAAGVQAVCDCGPGIVDCIGGRCQLAFVQSCFPQFDGGVDGL